MFAESYTLVIWRNRKNLFTIEEQQRDYENIRQLLCNFYRTDIQAKKVKDGNTTNIVVRGIPTPEIAQIISDFCLQFGMSSYFHCAGYQHKQIQLKLKVICKAELEANCKYSEGKKVNARVDALTNEYIIEVKPYVEWKSAIQQLLRYEKSFLNRQKVLYLFNNSDICLSDDDYNELMGYCQRLNIQLIVEDAPDYALLLYHTENKGFYSDFATSYSKYFAFKNERCTWITISDCVQSVKS